MNEYLIPISSLMLSFVSTYLCIKFIFSRQGLFWILPFILSLLIDFYILNLIMVPSLLLALPFQFSFFPLILSITYLIVIIQFRYTIKKSVPTNRYEDDMRKNFNEAKIIEKKERRSFLRNQKNINKKANENNLIDKFDVK
ncbi:MAG: hypothetical protein K6G51_02215 [Sphaerochaetaceae bacterium]|nr:hypothetical protein [Sphaerochaetaceae bacterium]